jgi:predicted transcriptional regulator
MTYPAKFDRAELRRLHAAGWTSAEMAKELGVTTSSVCNALRRLATNARVQEERLSLVNEPEPAPVAPRWSYAWVEEQVAAGVPRTKALQEMHRRRM